MPASNFTVAGAAEVGANLRALGGLPRLIADDWFRGVQARVVSFGAARIPVRTGRLKASFRFARTGPLTGSVGWLFYGAFQPGLNLRERVAAISVVAIQDTARAYNLNYTPGTLQSFQFSQRDF